MLAAGGQAVQSALVESALVGFWASVERLVQNRGDRTVIGLVFLVVLVTIVWVALDARDHDFSYSRGMHSTAGWVIGCILLWIVFFPWYVIERRKVPTRKGLQVEGASADLENLQKLADLYNKGILTSAEMEEQKAKILKRLT